MQRRFLFLQGPHGPFFHRLGGQLRAAGAEVWRVGFNPGDAAFWPDAESYIAYRGAAPEWRETFASLVDEHNVTDLVLYGDARPLHADAIAEGRARGLNVHVFEEGYLRPWWVTYERGGANANSRLMRTGLAEMRAALDGSPGDQPGAPAHWGDLRHHVFYGMLYHWFILWHALRGRAYPGYRPHRGVTVMAEFRLYLRRLIAMPLTGLRRRLAQARLARGGFPFHLCLLQLDHDASFRAHSRYAATADFLGDVVAAFAEGAPAHHHLVIKAHPLEDGRAPVRATLARLTARHGLRGRVHFLEGGKLSGLLDEACSAVTVNSTAAQQALWRGLPVKALGAAIYGRPGLVSDQPLPAFFRDPARPDRRAYGDFRAYLLRTSQVPGGFYSARGRRQLLRRAVDMMLCEHDPYDHLAANHAKGPQKLKLVAG